MNDRTIQQSANQSTFRAFAMLAITFLVSNWLFTSSLLAQGLDVSFGSFGAGAVSLSLSEHDVLTASTIASDGSIYLAGTTDYGGGDQNILIARFGSNGILDTSFGGFGVVPDGMVVTDLLLGEDRPLGIAITGNGKILTLIRAKPYLADTGELMLLRYNDDGSLDEAFGESGRITLESEILNSNKPRLEVIDEKIVTWNQYKVNRYEMDGSADNSFGIDGTVQFAEGFYATAADFADNKMYFGGGMSGGPAFAAFDQNGSPDSSFGVDGIAQPPFGVPHFVMTAIVVHNGMITAADTSVIYRVDFNGNLDSNFDVDGIVSNPEFAFVTDLILQPHGLVTASVYSNGSEFMAVRLNDEGQLDTTFGNDSGWMRLPAGSHSQAKQIFGYTNGKVLMVGDFEDGEAGESSFLAIRTAGFPKPTSRPNGGGGNLVTVPGTGGDDRIEIFQHGSNTLVNYPDLPGYEYEFEGVNSVVVESVGGDDQIKFTFESGPLDPNQQVPVELDIKSGPGDDVVYFGYFGSLPDATPTFDLGKGHDRLFAYVDNDCKTSPHAFEYFDGKIRRVLGSGSSRRQRRQIRYMNWYVFDEDSPKTWIRSWSFIEPCRTGSQIGDNGLGIIFFP